jgi:hypothetical protein
MYIIIDFIKNVSSSANKELKRENFISQQKKKTQKKQRQQNEQKTTTLNSFQTLKTIEIIEIDIDKKDY